MEDSKAREKIKYDIETTYIVEAGAGTGKTTLMVERILEIICRGKANFSEIVAITFTEKAANELQERIKAQLLEQLKNDSQNQNLIRAFRDIEHAHLTTIHGFCSSILREKPIEAGIDPNFIVSNEIMSKMLYKESWEKWIRLQVEDKDPFIRDILTKGITFEQMEKMAHLLFIHRDLLDFELQEVPSANIKKLKQMFREYTETLRTLLSSCINRTDRGYISIVHLLDNWNFLEKFEDQVFIRKILQGFTVKPQGNKKNWFPEENLTEIKTIIKTLREEIDTVKRTLTNNITQKFIKKLHHFLQYHEHIKIENNMLDFEDLLIATQKLLKMNKEVRQAFQNKFRYILVDEFQDTDPLQVEILFFLAEDGAKAESWEKVEIKKGKLFLVGDPKQSIYKFRRADIEIYETVKKYLGENACLTIFQNFRCTPQIIDWVNKAFSPLIIKPEDGMYQPAYTNLLPSRKQPCEVTSVWTLDAKEEKKSIIDIVSTEAKVIAKMIQLMIEESWRIQENKKEKTRTVTYGDIAIILRRFSYIDYFEKYLAKENIPYQVIGSKSYYSCIEVKTLVTLLRAMLDPYNFISIVATLRSPLFSVSDEDLFAYKHTHKNFDYRNVTSDSYIAKALLLLNEFHHEINKSSPVLFLEKIFSKTGILFTFMNMPRGEQKVANLMKIIDIARTAEQIGIYSFRSFVKYLDELERMEENEAESYREDDRENTVKLISIHRAKGLEFPVVFLGDLAGKSRRTDDIIVNKKRTFPAIKLSGKVELKTHDYDKEVQYEKSKVHAEEIRLLYVAATRAKDYLIIPNIAKGKGYLPLIKDQLINPLVYETLREQLINKNSISSDVIKEEKQETSFDFKEKRENWIHKRDIILSKAYKAEKIYDINKQAEKNFMDNVIHKTVISILKLFRNIASNDMFTECELNPLILHELSKYEFHISEEKRIRDLIFQAVRSPLLMRAEKSNQSWKALPFSVKINTITVKGTIDLCFEESEMLNIIFYKTDCTKNIHFEELKKKYSFHALLSILALQKISDKKIKDVIIFFLETATPYYINVTTKALQEAEKKLIESF